MGILTIEDYKKADRAALDKAREEIHVVDDIKKYIAWLNSPQGGMISIPVKLGYKDRPPAIHPSSLCKKNVCDLPLFYQAIGTPSSKSISSELQMTFDIGTLLHATLQEYLSRMFGDQFQAEVPLKQDALHIKASTDGKFEFPGVHFLLEIKSIKEGGQYGVQNVLVKPFEDHRRQLMTYMFCSNIPFGLILYVCKNNGTMLEHVVEWDQKLWDGLNNTCQTVVTAIETNTPLAPYTGGHCSSCDFVNSCEYGRKAIRGRRRVSV